jgi:hypothetical protein
LYRNPEHRQVERDGDDTKLLQLYDKSTNMSVKMPPLIKHEVTNL